MTPTRLNIQRTLLLLLIIVSIFNFKTFAQTGPGGVGNSSGSGGQPKNVLWLDSDNFGYSDGADVANWTDLSGNNNNLAQPTAIYTPIFQNDAGNLNGHPRVEFSKSDNRIVINPFPDMPTSGITTIVVYKTITGGDALVSYNTTATDNAYLLYNNTSLTSYINGSNVNSAISFTGGSWQIMAQKWKSSGGNVILNKNGNQVYSSTLGNGASIPSGGSLAIGGEQDLVDGGYSAAQDFTGEIAEIIMFNSSINQAQVRIIENYLSQKYNIALTTAGNDKYTGNGASYIYNVAGIGKESDGAHSQTCSGGLYLYEWNSTLANGEYVMLGHNNAVNNSTTIRTDAEISTCGAQAAWNRDWYVKKTSTDGIDTKLIFDFKEALTDGLYPGNSADYVLLYRAGTTGNYSVVTNAGQGVLDADQIYFNISDANLADGYYTIGTIDQTNSPVQGLPARTWYALVSGDWDNPAFWTLDPSGALPNNPANETPGNIDKVVIHGGKTITVSTNSKTVSQITVDGILQLGTTSGHNFTVIKGGGKIRLSSDNFPAGDVTDFVTAGQGEGTVVWQGTSFNLSVAHTFYNMEVSLNNPTDKLTLLSNYTINGSLTIKTGILQINDNASTTNLNIISKGDVTIQSNGQILTGTGNARHQFDFYGDLINNGTLKFTNRVAAGYTTQATDGIVDANFLSTNSNQSIVCSGISNFYRIEIDKGIDFTYELSIEATSTANFQLYGYANESHAGVSQLAANNNALGLLKGTVRIKSNVQIPHLTKNGNYNISEAARLWVDGGYVSMSVGIAIVPYGIVQVSAGTLESLVNSGLTIRDNGSVIIEGGTLNVNQIRTSVIGAGQVGSYIQTGGIVNLLGSNTATNYYVFNLTFPENVFQMSGGTLHIHQSNGLGGIFINSDPENVNVSGGTVICEINDNEDFIITSKAPFWDLIMRKTSGGANIFKLDEGVDVGATNEYLAVQPLVVLNDFTIEANNSEIFTTNNADVSIGRNFSINEGATYDFGANNTTFNGTEDGEFYIGWNHDDNYEQYLYKMTLNKPADKKLTIKGDPFKEIDYVQANSGNEINARILNITNKLTIESGILDQGKQSFRLFGEIEVKANGQCGVYVAGVTNPAAFVMFKDVNVNIKTEAGAIFGNVKMNPAPSTDIISFSSDVYIKRIGYYFGRIDIKNHKLKLDYLQEQSTTVDYDVSSGNNIDEMFITGGNSSDGGLLLYIPSNGTFAFPIGTLNKYTPAKVTITNFSDDGYIEINPVDKILQTTNLSGGDILSYYWRVRYEGFTVKPTVQYEFTYETADDDNSAEAGFYPGKVLDTSPFSRSYENDLNKVDETNNIITFNGAGSGFTLEQANYTAGVTNRFTGSPQVFYLRANGDWNNNNTWSFTRGGGSAGDYPKVGDIAVIRRLNAGYSGIVTVKQAENVAGVIFDDENGFSSGCPRVIFDVQNNFASYKSDLGTVDVAATHQGGTLNYNTHGAVIQYNIEDSYAEINALKFDGINDYAAIQNYNYNSTGNTAVTVETWIKTTDGNDQVIASFDRNKFWRLEIGGNGGSFGTIGFDVKTNTGIVDFGGTKRIDDGLWHHVAAVFDNGNFYIYIDGVLDASTSSGASFGSSATRFGFLGVGSKASYFNEATGPNNYFNGEMSDFRIWNVARSQAQISANKDAALTGGEAGLQIYYKLNDGGVSSTAVDLAGSNDATLFNFALPVIWENTASPFPTTDLSMDGDNDYIAINNYNYASTGLTQITVEAWINTTSGTNQVIASYDRNNYWRLEINGNGAGPGQIGFDINTDAGILDLGSTTRIDDGLWHHVAGVFNAGNAEIYIDGVLDASGSLGSTFGSGNVRYGFIGVGSRADFFDGNKGPMNFFNGKISDVRIWSTARTAVEISGNKDAVLIGTEPGLEIYYQLNESGSSRTANDLANNNDGDLMNYSLSGAWVKGPWGADFPGGDFGGFNNYPNALVLYSWSGATANADVTLSDKATEYPQMWFEGGNRSRRFRFPDADVTVHGMFYVPGQCIVVANGNSANTITFEQSMNMGHSTCCGPDGQFLFPGDAEFPVTVIVNKNLQVAGNNNSLLGIENAAGGTVVHKLIAKGNISTHTSGGVINLGDGNPAKSNVELELQGTSNNTFADNAGSGVKFYRIIMNKGSDFTNTFSLDDNFTLTGATSGAGVKKSIEMLNGTLIMNDPAINLNINTGNDNFEIAGASCLEVRQGQVNVSGNSTGILLDGKLLISGGTVNLDGAVGNKDNYIEYSASGNAEIEITSGTLTVGSQIRRGLGSISGILKYNQSGGTVVVGKNAAPEGNRAVFEVLNPGSSFTHTGGSISIVRQQTSPTTATLYLDPETSNLSPGTTINLGNANTPANQEFGIYSTINLQNLVIDNTSSNNPKAKMWVVPLSIDENLDIQSSTIFNANGLDLNMYGDFTNSGTFDANGNTTYFKGAADQLITGNTSFYNLINQNTANLNLFVGNAQISIDNNLDIQSGTVNDNGNDIFVYGDINNDGLTVYGASGDGISMVGTSLQTMTGNGTYGKLSINNANGITVPVGNKPIINDFLKMESGVFNIGGNLLTLAKNCIIQEANVFGPSNMIQTNVSFTDNGVKKFFPSGVETFVYPVGAGGKYTPVNVIVTQNTSSTAYLIAKPANEIHPTIQEDAEAPDPEIVDVDNVLQYYWVMTSGGFSDLTGTLEFFYDPSDVSATAPYTELDYITAKLLDDGTGNWYKFDDVSTFDEPNKKLIFNFFVPSADIEITGDYSAGVDGASFNGAIPDNVPLYVSNGSGTVMDWNTPSTWVHDPGLPDIPKGARVKILAGDVVSTAANYINAYTSEINGTLDVNTTYGNRVGNVSGTGTLYTEIGSLPAGYYERFLSASGGTLEFGGNSDLSILSNITEVNNIKFSGTGRREIPNTNLTVLGDFIIDGTDASLLVINEFNNKIDLRKDVVFNNGSFDAGTGASAIIDFNGSTGLQTISGTNSFTGSNAFNHIIMNNGSGIAFDIPAEIAQTLTFQNGIINVNPSNSLTLTNISETVITGYSSTKFVDGNLVKYINSGGDFIYPVGNSGRYGELLMQNVSGTGNYEAQYYNTNPNNAPYNLDPNSFLAPLQIVSENEFWRVNTLNPAQTSLITLRWDASSGVSSDATERQSLRVSQWVVANSRWEESHTNITASGTSTAGTLSANPTVQNISGNSYFTIASELVTLNTWQGDVAGDETNWANPLNWTLGSVPNSITDVTIPTNPSGGAYFPVISAATQTRKLTIQNSASVTIISGGSLTASGSLNLDGTLKITSSTASEPSGSFIDNGSVIVGASGKMIAERYVNANQWHELSSPIKTATGSNTSAVFTRSHSSGYFNTNFYEYNEAFDLDANPATTPTGPNIVDFDQQKLAVGWKKYHNGNGGSNKNLIENQGYMFWTNENTKLIFSGEPATGTYNATGLTLTQNDVLTGESFPIDGINPQLYDGWELLGNPYPSSIDWDIIAATKLTNVDAGIYIWDGDQYSGYINGISVMKGNQGKDIAPMQGFFVHVNNASGGSVNFDNTTRVHSSQSFLKGGEQRNPNLLKINVQANGFEESTAIYFKENATKNYDGNFDLVRNFGTNKNVPSLYTKIADKGLKFALNCLPSDEMTGTSLPLCFDMNDADKLVLKVSELNDFDGVHVYLEDKLIDTLINLRTIDKYTFSLKGNEKQNRFVIHFVQNSAPFINENISDIETDEDNPFKYSISKTSFADSDLGDNISYSVKVVNRNELPSWLRFDNKTLTFSGTPDNSNVGDIEIELVAKDMFGAINSQNFTIRVNNINDAPILQTKIEDLYIKDYSSIYTYTIPANTFIDIDKGDVLTYSAELENGDVLPQEIFFDNENVEFVVRTDKKLDLSVKLTATDIPGASASDVFRLNITGKELSDLTVNNKVQISVYPNPTTGNIFVNIPDDLIGSQIFISDISGKIIKQTELFLNVSFFDLSKLPSGTYFIKVKSETLESNYKIIKE